ncbi:MAG: type II secretion system protein GspN [Spirochaetes bacterium]|nr:type II secretion system protein GspN [Spirochaetota bacterium]
MLPTIKRFITNIKAFIQETWRLPYAKFYFALTFIMVPFFVFFTFPYEILIRNQLQKLESTMGRNIQIGMIDFSIIGDSYIDYLNVVLADGAEIRLKDIAFNISLNPYRLFISKKIKGEIQIGSFKFTKQDIAITHSLKTSFNIQFDGKTGIPTNGDINLDISSASLKGITIKGFDIPPLKFSSINGDGTLKNRRLRIDSLKFSGNDVNGEIKGSIQIEPIAHGSKLNLYIYVNSDSRIFQEYKMLLDNLEESGGKVKIEITGNFNNPNVKMPFKGSETTRPPKDEFEKAIQKQGTFDED